MIQRVSLVQGWTETISFTLYADGSPIDLTGRTITMRVFDKNDDAVTFAGSISTIDATAGKVGFTPDATDLLAASSPYTVRFKIMSDGYFVPNEEPIVFVVRE